MTTSMIEATTPTASHPQTGADRWQIAVPSQTPHDVSDSAQVPAAVIRGHRRSRDPWRFDMTTLKTICQRLAVLLPLATFLVLEAAPRIRF
jgi:hypothetical protein